jgi:heme exporter protein A
MTAMPQSSSGSLEQFGFTAATDPARAAEASFAIDAVGLSRELDGRMVLRDLNFSVAPGEFVALLGANGAGKSTLLKILAMLLGPTSGTLRLFGEPCTLETARLRSRIGLIGHGAMLYRDLSPLENLTFFGRLYGVSEPAKRAMELLEWLELGWRAKDPVKTFSRGMLQRVAIARALMHEPELLLADEPFAGLDAPSMDALASMLTTLHRQGRTVILTNHDIPQSLLLAKRTIVLRGGAIVFDGPTASTDAKSVLAFVGSHGQSDGQGGTEAKP